MHSLSFQSITSKLLAYWQGVGCAVIQPYDLEVGAGTFHPACIVKSLQFINWNVSYIQPSRRPTDSRYSMHPNRLGRYYQLQVILKPSPDNVQELYLGSIEELGLNSRDNDIRFIEDDWASPTLGASGLGWEVWCNGMEISQFTYMQQIGGIEMRPTPVEIAYGLERLALYIQRSENVMDLRWNDDTTNPILYRDVYYDSEREFSYFNESYADTEILLRHFKDYEKQALDLMHKDLPIAAYDFCLKASHIFNLLDSRKVISATERQIYIGQVRHLAKMICKKICGKYGV